MVLGQVRYINRATLLPKGLYANKWCTRGIIPNLIMSRRCKTDRIIGNSFGKLDNSVGVIRWSPFFTLIIKKTPAGINLIAILGIGGVNFEMQNKKPLRAIFHLLIILIVGAVSLKRQTTLGLSLR